MNSCLYDAAQSADTTLQGTCLFDYYVHDYNNGSVTWYCIDLGGLCSRRRIRQTQGDALSRCQLALLQLGFVLTMWSIVIANALSHRGCLWRAPPPVRHLCMVGFERRWCCGFAESIAWIR